jgi:hypothetical protein
MDLAIDNRRPVSPDEYLFGRGAAWFAYFMTLGLMIMDYVDRQVIVSLFPFMKALSSLDVLIPGRGGYAVGVAARRPAVGRNS